MTGEAGTGKTVLASVLAVAMILLHGTFYSTPWFPENSTAI